MTYAGEIQLGYYKSAPRFYYDFYIFQVDFYGSDD